MCLLCQVLAGQIKGGPCGIRKRLWPSEASLPSGFLQVEGPETDLPLALISTAGTLSLPVHRAQSHKDMHRKIVLYGIWCLP